MSTATEYSLAELMICAAAEAWRNDGEVLATGIGLLPRLAASLCMRTTNTDLMMTDSEAHMLSTPNPVSGRSPDSPAAFESWMGYSRIFDNVWSGKRHAMVGPTQIDRYGQANISFIGGTHQQPKVQMLGARGFPGNSISHQNSFFVPSHNRRVFVESDECDMVGTVGYNPRRLTRGRSLDDVDIRLVITDLCVMDFNGPEHAMRLVSLHPGVTAEQVQENTGWEVFVDGEVPTTAAPTEAQLAIIRELDPKDFRARQLKDNPPGNRAAGA